MLNNLSRGKGVILQLLNAAAGIDCSKDCEDVAYEAFLLMTKHSEKDQEVEDIWSSWDSLTVKVVPPVETADTLRSMQVCYNLKIIFFLNSSSTRGNVKFCVQSKFCC